MHGMLQPVVYVCAVCCTIVTFFKRTMFKGLKKERN